MSQKIFLTSALAMGFVAPAFAEPSNTGTFPNDGYMQEDYTYTNAATSTNMDGVYEGTVNAVAEYDIIDYIVNAGQYLPADSETVITCPAGSYCPGISGNVNYNQTTAQGIQTCPTGYASSAAGASSDTECYRQCSGNVTIEHATAVTGNDYYGAGVDTCEPTACEHGWHVKAAVTAPNLTNIIGTSEEGASYAYIKNDGSFSESSAAHGQSYYGISNNNTWAVDYGSSKGMLIGQGRCSTRAGADYTWTNSYNVIDSNFVSSLADETGQEGAQYCYCNVIGYKDGSGNMQAVSSPWVFSRDAGGWGMCGEYCAYYCARDMQGTNSGWLAFRATLLGAIESSPAMCEANVININWSDASAADISANNAGTATYGEDVRTPVKAQTKKGQTFRGWRFSAPEQTDLP